MANIVFNIAKGRGIELYTRVHNNDPAASELVVALYTGAEPATLNDEDTFAAIEATTLAESVDVNYARQLFDPGDGDWPGAITPDDTNNLYDFVLPDRTNSAGMTGETLTTLVVGYDPNEAGGTDAEIVPITGHDFDVTTDGSDLTMDFGNATTYVLRAS